MQINNSFIDREYQVRIYMGMFLFGFSWNFSTQDLCLSVPLTFNLSSSLNLKQRVRSWHLMLSMTLGLYSELKDAKNKPNTYELNW